MLRVADATSSETVTDAGIGTAMWSQGGVYEQQAWQQLRPSLLTEFEKVTGRRCDQ